MVRQLYIFLSCILLSYVAFAQDKENSFISIRPFSARPNGIQPCTVAVQVNNSQGTPLSGISVTLNAAGCMVTPASFITGVNGKAVFNVTKATAGAVTITASCNGVTISKGIISEGAAAIYSFDGNVKDISGNGNNGTVTGGASYTEGRSGTGMSFNGSNQYVTVPHSTALSGIHGSMIEAWVKPKSTTATIKVIAKKSYTDFGDYGLYVSNTAAWSMNQSALKATGMHNLATSGEGSISAGAWHHLVSSWDGDLNDPVRIEGATKIRVNTAGFNPSPAGLYLEQKGWTGQTYSQPLSIGRSGDGTMYFDGEIDELRIYNRELYDIELKRNYNSSTVVTFDLVPPTSFIATTQYPESVMLTWTNQNENVTTYRIYRSTVSPVALTSENMLWEVPHYRMKWIDYEVDYGVAYHYVITSCCFSNESDKSLEVTATPSKAAANARWFSGNGHQHSWPHTYESQIMHFKTKEVADKAKYLGWDFIFNTEHCSLGSLYLAQDQCTASFIDFGNAQEISGGGEHRNAYFIKSFVSPDEGAEEQQNQNVLEQGGLLGPQHTGGYTLTPISTYELINTDTKINDSYVQAWVNNYLLKGYKVSASGGNDAHGQYFTANAMHFMIFADRLSYRSLKDSFYAGRTAAVDGTNISCMLTVNGKMIGDTVIIQSGQLLSLELSADSSQNISKVDLYKKGALWKTWSPNTANWSETVSDTTGTSNSFYRIEAKNGAGVRMVCTPVYVVIISNTKHPTVSVFPSGMTTNKAFTASLSVDMNHGFFSTNGSVFIQFDTNGTDITIDKSTTLRCFGSNVVGFSATNTYSYIFDTSAPTISGVPTNFSTNAPFTINLSVDQNYGFWSTNGSSFSQFTTNGAYIAINSTATLTYFGRDLLGNTSITNYRSYTTTDTPPSISGAPTGFVTNKPFTITLSVNKNYGFWSTNGSAWKQFTIAGEDILIDHTATLRCFGSNAVGISATNAYTYIFDTSAPTISGAPANVTTNKTFVVSLAVDQNHGYWSTNGSVFSKFTTNGISISINGTTVLTYYGSDYFGNTSITNTRTYTFDLAAPVISGVPPDMKTNSQFLLHLAVDENFGYFSTNGSPYTQFGIAGTNIQIERSTMLSFFGRDSLGNTSITNTRIYTIGLVAYWKFDAIFSSNSVDSSGYGHTINLSNMDVMSCLKTGVFGNALSFDGINDYARSEPTSVLSALGSNNADFSASFFIKLHAGWNGTWRHVMHKGNVLPERICALFMNPSNNRLNYRVSTYSNYNEGGNSSSEMPLNSWVHVAYVKRTNTLSLYLNGILDSWIKLKGAVSNNTGPMFLGRDPNMLGAAMSMDDVRMYSRALDSNEIIALAAYGGAGTITPLVPSPLNIITSGSAGIDPLTKMVGISYGIGSDIYSAAPLAVACDLSSGISENGADNVETIMEFAFAPSGSAAWKTIDSSVITGNIVHMSRGTYSNTWHTSSDIDVSKHYDVRINGIQNGIQIQPYIISNIDFSRCFTTRTILDKFFALNNPCRRGSITFANLTKDASITIFSISGKKIAHLAAPKNNENGVLKWDVLNDQGQRVGPGVYICRASSSSGTKTIRVIIQE